MKAPELHKQFTLNGNIFTATTLAHYGQELQKKGSAYEKIIGAFLVDWLAPSDVLGVQTSGSTGTPKTIQLKKQHMVQSAIATGTFFNLKPTNTALHCLPTEYIAGKMMLVRAMVLGLEITCVAPSAHPLQDDLSQSYDFAAMVPLQVQHSIAKVNTIKTLIVGGAPCTQDLKSALQPVSTNIYETYGMTETITHIAVKKINNTSQTHPQNFRTLPNITISQDDRGCLIIQAPKISDTKVVTNDMVNLRSETEFEWLGRYDTIINSGGVKLIPEQIEKQLASLITRNKYFVAGIPDSTLGERLVLFIEGDTNNIQLVAQIENIPTLDKFQKPKELIIVPKFEETSNGKLNRIATINTWKNRTT